jgi:hypothetical protein
VRFPQGCTIDSMGVLQEEFSWHNIKNDRSDGVTRLNDVNSQDPVRFLADLKEGKGTLASQSGRLA